MNDESVQRVAAQAAARLNLAIGRDAVWRGRCACCRYGKPTVQMKVRNQGIAISWVACGQVSGIAAIAGIASDLLVAPESKPSKVARALKLWDRATPAVGSPVDTYLHGRGINIPMPSSIAYLKNQWNWNDGQTFPAMVALVERLPEEGEELCGRLLPSGVHVTFLERSAAGSVQKAATETNTLSLGQLQNGGVWLSPEIGHDLAVAEGIETALSVMQITGLPTVATLSAAGMRTFRWPPQVSRLWIAADNDRVGIEAAKALLARSLSSGLQAQIKIPKDDKNDFNDLIKENI